MLFHRRPGTALGFERLEPGGDMDRLDLAQLVDAVRRTPRRETTDGAIVSSAGVVVGDLGDEEFEGTFSRAGFLEKKPRWFAGSEGGKGFPALEFGRQGERQDLRNEGVILSLSELFGVIPSTLFGILSLSENGTRWTGQQSRDGGRVDLE
jgi:hypothetical protein